MRFRDRFLHSPIAKAAYKIKFYTDTGISQVSWLTGKVPELAGMLTFMTYFQINPPRSVIAWIIFAVFASLFLFGFVLKKTGLYDVERYTIAQKDPVQAELLEAARIVKTWRDNPPIYNPEAPREKAWKRSAPDPASQNISSSASRSSRRKYGPRFVVRSQPAARALLRRSETFGKEFQRIMERAVRDSVRSSARVKKVTKARTKRTVRPGRRSS